ncbi:hypothetical protein ABKV19_008804 [Rosa sericea]
MTIRNTKTETPFTLELWSDQHPLFTPVALPRSLIRLGVQFHFHGLVAEKLVEKLETALFVSRYPKFQNSKLVIGFLQF